MYIFSFNNSCTYCHSFISTCMIFSELNQLTTLHGNSSKIIVMKRIYPKSFCTEIDAKPPVNQILHWFHLYLRHHWFDNYWSWFLNASLLLLENKQTKGIFSILITHAITVIWLQEAANIWSILPVLNSTNLVLVKIRGVLYNIYIIEMYIIDISIFTTLEIGEKYCAINYAF